MLSKKPLAIATGRFKVAPNQAERTIATSHPPWSNRRRNAGPNPSRHQGNQRLVHRA